jgi:hypothetical protein
VVAVVAVAAVVVVELHAIGTASVSGVCQRRAAYIARGSERMCRNCDAAVAFASARDLRVALVWLAGRRRCVLSC